MLPILRQQKQGIKLESKITPRFLAVGVGEIWLPRISMGKEDVKFLQ